MARSRKNKHLSPGDIVVDNRDGEIIQILQTNTYPNARHPIPKIDYKIIIIKASKIGFAMSVGTIIFYNSDHVENHCYPLKSKSK